MQNKYLIIGFLLMLLIFIVGCNETLSRDSAIVVQKINECDNCNDLYKNLNDPLICEHISMRTLEPARNAPALSSRDYCYTNVANNIKDSTKCEYIEETYYKDQCYQNLLVCDKISNEFSFSQYCYEELGKTTGNPKDCEKATKSSKDRCYSGIVQKTGDTSYCNFIQDSLVKNSCLGRTYSENSS